MNTYDKIETVMKALEVEGLVAVAPHEFSEKNVTVDHPQFGPNTTMNARAYIGCSESALGRRLREMARDGKVSRSTREGKAFKEFSLVKKEA